MGRGGSVRRRLLEESHPTRHLFARTRPLRYRNVVKNTLADTPSGYIQDPRAAPAAMVTYTRLTAASSAALDAMEEERQLMEKEELAYHGYTTLAIQSAKQTVMDPAATPAALERALTTLRAELATVQGLEGSEVDQPPTAEKVMLLKWRRWHEKQEDANNAFRVPTPPVPDVCVRLAEDGSEEIVSRRRNRPVLNWDGSVAEPGRGGGAHTAGERPTTATTLATGGAAVTPDPEHGATVDLWQCVAEEELDPALLAPTRVVVSSVDVNHVRYVVGLACRRLRRFAEAEEAHLAILHSDVRNVDAIESLLELYTGLNDGASIQRLLDFLTREYDAGAERDDRPAHADAGAVPPAGEPTEAVDTAGPPQPTSSHSDETVQPGGGAARKGRTSPLMSPVDVALSLLADMIVESATRHCAEFGEGSTSRYFLDCLSPIASSLDRRYTTLLIEALFLSMDEQHYVARFELDEAAAQRDDRLIYSVVIAFLKMLLVTRIPSMVEEPVQFRFFILSKLHSALRSSGRKKESYRFCEEMLALYRANSSVYQRRRNRILREQARERMRREGQEQQATASSVSEAERREEEDDAALPRLPLDDLDASYRSSLFQYLNDRALDSAAVGREMCLSVMEEYPEAGAPWETLALILHREDPKGNLSDALTAARRGLALEPFNLSLILTCANFYKADGRFALYEIIMDRYRLLCYMLENAASDEDLRSVGEEILEAERRVVEGIQSAREEELQLQRDRLGGTAPALVRSMEEWSRMHSETKSPRTYTYQQPVTNPSLELHISEQRPREMNVDFRDTNDALGRRAGGGGG